MPTSVVKVEGPERIADEWWRPRPDGKVMAANIVPPVRDYYRVEDDDGGRFWLFRDGPLNARQVVPARLLRVILPCRYAELQVTTNYSFLRGGSHPGELVLQAASLGHYAIGIADRNTLAGVVRAYSAVKELLRRDRHPGRELDQAAGRRAARNPRRLFAARLSDESRGLQAAVAAAEPGQSTRPRRANAISPSRSRRICRWTSWPSSCRRGRSRIPPSTTGCAGSPASIAAAATSPPPCCSAATMPTRVAYLDNLATQMKVQLVATNDVHYHVARAPGAARRGHRHPPQMHRRGAGLPPLRLGRAASQAGRRRWSGCSASIRTRSSASARSSIAANSASSSSPTSIRSMYEGGETPMQKLERLTWKGAACRYPEGIPEKVVDEPAQGVRPDRAARRSRPTS